MDSPVLRIPNHSVGCIPPLSALASPIRVINFTSAPEMAAIFHVHMRLICQIRIKQERSARIELCRQIIRTVVQLRQVFELQFGKPLTGAIPPRSAVLNDVLLVVYRPILRWVA